jgi:polyisoprenyl-teichoic acid--peptidoglycan teichoic acid transferase
LGFVTTGIQESTLTVPVDHRTPRVARAAVRKRVTRAQRFLFVFALLTFGLASTYTSVVMLARVTPALFPGKDLTNLGIIKPLALLDTPVLAIKPPGDSSVFNKRINLLILGVDRRPSYGDDGKPLPIPDDENAGHLTDTIMVATIDPVGKSSSILSFPRDMLIEIHTKEFTYDDRINTSFGVGVRNGKTVSAGIDQLKLDMKENFGIEIDHYVVLDFKGVEKLVDAVDGVEVDIPYDLSVGDWYYSDDDRNGRWVSFPSGLNKLDGYHAVAFGRHREYDSDFKRVKRQQLVIKAALSKVFSMQLLNDPLGLYDAYSSTVRTDIPKSKMPGYGALLKDTNGSLATYSLGDPVNGVETMIPYTTPGGAAVQLWEAENVQYWLSQVFTKTAYSNVAVEIQNGYGEDGTVRTAALGRYLKYSRGLSTVSYGPDQVAQPHTTITLYGGAGQVASEIAGWMGIPESEIVTLPKEDSSLPDVVIVIGKDFQVPGG